MPTGADQVAELETQVTTLETTVADLTKKLEVALADGGDDVAKTVEMQGQLNDLTKQLGDMTTMLEQMSKALEDANTENEAIAKLSPEHLEIYKALEKKDKPAFLQMSEEDKEKETKKRASADDTVVIEGQTIRKSAVGEATFTVMKSQADRIAKAEKDVAVEKAAREKAVFEKTADDKYGHVPGSTSERADMLAAIDKMEDPLKKLFTKVFEQSEKLGAAGFGKLGHPGGGTGVDKDKIAKATTSFETKAAEIKKRDNLTQSQAFSKARKEFPDLFKAYQEAGSEEGAGTQ